MVIPNTLFFLKPILYFIIPAIIAGYLFATIIITYFPASVEFWLIITSSFFVFVLILTVPLLIPDKIKEKFRRNKDNGILGPGKKDIKAEKGRKK